VGGRPFAVCFRGAGSGRGLFLNRLHQKQRTEGLVFWFLATPIAIAIACYLEATSKYAVWDVGGNPTPSVGAGAGRCFEPRWWCYIMIKLFKKATFTNKNIIPTATGM
jgi:hypothetical protein